MQTSISFRRHGDTRSGEYWAINESISAAKSRGPSELIDSIDLVTAAHNVVALLLTDQVEFFRCAENRLVTNPRRRRLKGQTACRRWRADPPSYPKVSRQSPSSAPSSNTVRTIRQRNAARAGPSIPSKIQQNPAFYQRSGIKAPIRVWVGVNSAAMPRRACSRRPTRVGEGIGHSGACLKQIPILVVGSFENG